MVRLRACFIGLWNDFGTNISRKAYQHSVLKAIAKVVGPLQQNHQGGVFLAYDGGEYWREKAFPHYKWKRKNKKSDDGMDWAW